MRSHLAAVLSCTALLVAATPASAASIWTTIASGTAEDITAVDYRAADQLYYATSNGHIFKNGSLMAGSPGVGVSFTGLELNPSGTIGLASANNGKLYRFNGTSWVAVNLNNKSWDQACSGNPAVAATPTGNLSAVAWANDTTAYVPGVDRGVVLKTTDGTNFSDASRQADGTCKVDGGFGDYLSDVATVPGSDIVYFVTSGFGARRISTDGLTSSAASRNNTAANCFSVPMHIALDATNPNRNFVAADCSGSLALGYSSDGGTNYDISQEVPNGEANDLTGFSDVTMAGGIALAVGKAGTILVDSDGQNAYLQRAGGSEATTDWLAADKFDASHAAVGGRGGKLVISTQADQIPDLVAPAGTITGPAATTAGTPTTFTANVADNTGGSGIDLASFAWSATGIPAATGNPVTVTFPSPGTYALNVTFKDLAGNSGTATKSVTVGQGATVIPPGTVNPTPAKTTSVPGGSITLKGPRTCVRVGQTFTATLAFKRSTKKGAKKVKVTRVDFSIDGKIVKKDRKAPFKQKLSVQSYLPNSTHTLKARAYIKVKRGKSPKKSVSVKFQVCAS